MTKNEEQNLPGCMHSVSWCDDIHVFDSFSDDQTVKIALESGAKVIQRVFDDWSTHQNWALANIKFKYSWILYLDADERVTDSLHKSLFTSNLTETSDVAFAIRRRDFAWNKKWLRYSQISPYYLRLFKPNKMRYERLVNPISLPDGHIGKLKGYLDHYPFSKGITCWIQRHIEYASLEAKMELDFIKKKTSFSILKALFNKEFNIRRYHQKGLFYKLPGRPVVQMVLYGILEISFSRMGEQELNMQHYRQFMSIL